jgi:hypothetical protein
MVAYNKFETAMESLCNKLIDAFGNTDIWKAVIHTDVPVAADVTIANLTQITGTNGYTTGGNDITFNSSRAAGTITAVATDVTWNASGTWPAAQYVSIYDDTSAADNLWCWFDYGSTFTVASGETFTLDFGATLWTMV